MDCSYWYTLTLVHTHNIIITNSAFTNNTIGGIGGGLLISSNIDDSAFTCNKMQLQAVVVEVDYLSLLAMTLVHII